MAKPPGFFQTLLPHSLRRQFILAVSAIAILIVAGGLTAVQSLRVSAETSRQLTEKRLELMHDAQNLVQRTQLIEHESQRLLAADSLDFMQSRYIEVIAQLESLDALVARLAESSSDPSILTLHQASQLFRNTTHIVARLQKDLLGEGVSTHPSSLTETTANREKAHRFHKELESHVEAMALAAMAVSDHYTLDFRDEVRRLSATTKRHEKQVLALLAASLLLAFLVSKYFLGRHVLTRLHQVSRRLRYGEAGSGQPCESVTGNDEIGEMARAVEQFLVDRQQLLVTQESLRQEEELMRAVTNSVQSAVLLVDNEDRIHFANPAAERLFGYSREELIGVKLHDTLVPPAFRQRARKGFAIFTRTGEGPALQAPLELYALRKDGRTVFVELFVGRVRRGGHWWAVGAAIDISARKEKERILVQLAETDQLTGVKNRRSFLQLAEEEFRCCGQTGTALFLLMLDLDHFKVINDTYGHGVGDEVLREFARVCSANLRDSDLFGRIGGEEFAVLMVGLTWDSALGVAERIRSAFYGITLNSENSELQVSTSVSIGLAGVDPAKATVANALEKADAALYRAKGQGRNRVVAIE